MKKSKGGQGKREIIRNKALVILKQADPIIFNLYTLGKLFNRDPKTISGILERELGVK